MFKSILKIVSNNQFLSTLVVVVLITVADKVCDRFELDKLKEKIHSIELSKKPETTYEELTRDYDSLAQFYDDMKMSLSKELHSDESIVFK